MPDLADHFRSSQSGLSLGESLQQPVSALLGVSDRAADALGGIGVETVFDLGSSWLFANAATVIEASSSGLGLPSTDLLEPGVSPPRPDDFAALPVESLRGLSHEKAEALVAALEVATIRELALWPPRRVAHRLVGEAAGGTLHDPEESQAEALRPRLGEYPTERVYYDTLAMLGMGESADRKPLTGTISLQPVVDAPIGFKQPAVGALVTLSQSWYAKGITLGHMLHSLALAPGEATRIAVVDWTRRTRATVAESIEEAERLESATDHSRAISEVQNAVADEMQSGGSMSSGWARSESKGKAGGFSVGGGVAGAFKGVTGVLGFGGGSSSSRQSAETTSGARSSSWSIGSRSVMAEMTQRVNDRTEQHSSSVRNRRASAVREVSQSEHEEVSTRVVANYNHMHALTVQYYEVVQVYRVLAQVHSVQRVLYLPFELLDFCDEGGSDVVARFRAQLVESALTDRVRELLLDDHGEIEVRSVVRVRLPVLVGELVAEKTMVAARLLRTDLPEGGAESPPEMAPPPGEAPGGVLTAPPPLGRLVARPGPVLDTLPGDAELVAVSFNEVGVDRVRLDRPGVPAAQSTYAVSEAMERVDFGSGIPLRGVEAIHVARTAGVSGAETMTLHYESRGRERRLSVPLDLVEGTSFQRAAALRADPTDRTEELTTHLQANRGYYTRAVLEGLDSASLVMLLAAFTWRGKPLADQVEPNPLGVAGNFLVLRAPVEDDEPAGIGDGGTSWGELVRERALTAEQKDARLVPIPTGGVFAEAVLGRSNSAEKLDITRFWNWQDSPIPLQPPEIAPVGIASRATAEDLKPGQLGPPVLNVLNPSSLPDPAGLSAALGTLASANLFRDMSGLAGTQSAAQAAAAGTLGAATEAGKLAGANLKTVTDQAVAMGQAAADMWKTLHGPGGGDGGGGSGGSVSADGARINHGRDMDRRGVSGGGGPPSESGGGGVPMSESPGALQAGANGGDARGSGFSRELAFADTAAAGVSPALLSGTVSSLGGGAVSLLGGGVFSPMPGPPAASQVHLSALQQDLEDLGKTFTPKLDLKRVTLVPMAKQDFKDVGFAAWTNSATEVQINLALFEKDVDAYVKAGWSANEALLLARIEWVSFLRHEVHHVQQFKAAGSHPKKFAEMVKYEEQAYRKSFEWIDKGHAKKHLIANYKKDLQTLFPDPGDIDQHLASLLPPYKTAFRKACAFFLGLVKKIGTGKEDALRNEMSKNGYLPKTLGKAKVSNYGVTDLYK